MSYKILQNVVDVLYVQSYCIHVKKAYSYLRVSGVGQFEGDGFIRRRRFMNPAGM